MVSHYSTDQQVGVTLQDMKQFVNTGRKEDCKPVHMWTMFNLKYCKNWAANSDFGE